MDQCKYVQFSFYKKSIVYKGCGLLFTNLQLVLAFVESLVESSLELPEPKFSGSIEVRLL